MALSDNNMLITPAEASAMTALGVRTIYSKEKKGEFPKSVSLGGNKKAFVKAEIQEWIEKMIASRDNHESSLKT